MKKSISYRFVSRLHVNPYITLSWKIVDFDHSKTSTAHHSPQVTHAHKAAHNVLLCSLLHALSQEKEKAISIACIDKRRRRAFEGHMEKKPVNNFSFSNLFIFIGVFIHGRLEVNWRSGKKFLMKWDEKRYKFLWWDFKINRKMGKHVIGSDWYKHNRRLI